MNTTLSALKHALDIISRTTSSAFVKTMLEEAIAREEAQAAEPSSWLIRKVPNTKDQYFIAEGLPPSGVLEIYGIEQTKEIK